MKRTPQPELGYTEIPERAKAALAAEEDRRTQVRERIKKFASVAQPAANRDGEVEMLGGVEVVHRFIEAAGDSETVRWHLVDAGRGEPVVFLHGIPDSWFMWHRQIEALAPTHRAIAVDLKGYGQSDKKTGDYRQEGVAEQLLNLFDELDLERFNLVTHDRGTVIADYLAANHPERVLRYARGEQHLYHFNPELAPQEKLFTDPATVGVLSNPHLMVVSAYTLLCTHPVADDDIRRTIAEFSHPQIGWAVPRYFNSSSFRKEWIDRRSRLMERWRFPVLAMQGYHDPRQPREFYEGIERHLPDAHVAFIDAGHFFVLENPEQTTLVIADFMPG
jgi:pimeloyl-ACP methyl ester carboxylesterase